MSAGGSSRTMSMSPGGDGMGVHMQRFTHELAAQGGRSLLLVRELREEAGLAENADARAVGRQRARLEGGRRETGRVETVEPGELRVDDDLRGREEVERARSIVERDRLPGAPHVAHHRRLQRGAVLGIERRHLSPGWRCDRAACTPRRTPRPPRARRARRAAASSRFESRPRSPSIPPAAWSSSVLSGRLPHTRNDRRDAIS